MKEQVATRSTCSYQNECGKFLHKGKRKFNLQYFNIYAARFKLLKPKLLKSAKEKWGEQFPVRQLVDVKSDEECIVVGLLFRKMELQPGILKEICEEENVVPLPVSEKYASDDDLIILEEEQQRIELVGEICLPTVLTGSGFAARGYENNGKFHVKEFTYPSLAEHSNIAVDQSLQDGEDRFVLFISGLGIGNASENLMDLQLLIDIVTGRIAGCDDHKFFSKIVRVVIAGNALSKDIEDKESEKQAKYLSRNVQAKSVSAIKSFDDILVQLGSCVPVDVMAGDYDPTNQFLPQQPLHKCMFPCALRYSTVQSVTNPYKAMVGGRPMLGTSGQNISNIYQYSGFEDRLDILQATLLGGHVSPTSPDTLSCYPYYEQDPFVIDVCPDIYFAGNQPEFSTRLVEHNNGRTTRLFLIPEFHISSVAVLVNLRDLSAQPISINSSFS